MSFFDSEIVKAEMQEIDLLQKDIYKNIFVFPLMSPDEKKFHINLLEKLIERQQLFYTRLSLSDDPKAKELKSKVLEGLSEMGFSKVGDVNVVFQDLKSLLDSMKEQLDRSDPSL